MRIAQISDCHIAIPPGEGDDRLNDLVTCIAHVNGLDPAPQLVVHTGDISHDAKPEEYAQARAALSALKAPLLVLPGNRDRRPAFKQAFGDLLPANCHDEFIQYHADYDDLRLVMLDTVSLESNKGQLCDDRLAHLQAMLAGANGKQVVILMHHPTFEITASRYPFQFETTEMAEAFATVVEQHPNIVSIHCGHTHRTATGQVAGVPASTIPSMAVDLRLGEPSAMNEIAVVLYLS